MTPQMLAQIMDCPLSRAVQWYRHLDSAMASYEINTMPRIAAFVAQVGHESGRLLYVRELWNPAQCPWQARYEGRKDLGNIKVGDGARFKGRGLIQITGRANYRECGQALGIPLENNPELLEIPKHAALSAAWFWGTHGCNALADAGDFDSVSDAINIGRKTAKVGDANGYADRLALFVRAKVALGYVSAEVVGK